MNPSSRSGDRPRILFVATDLSTGGGVNKVIRDLAVMFKRRLSADVVVVNARSARPSAYTFPSDVEVECHGPQSLVSYFRLLLRLRSRRPDVVIGSWTQDNILLTLAFLFSRTRVVLVEHSSRRFHGWAIRLLRRIVYPFASDVIVLNHRDLERYRGYLTNVRLIPNPVFPTTDANRSREKLIIAVGHLIPVKQFDHAIRAMARSRLEDEGWSMAIIGSGSEAHGLSKLIEAEGLKRTRLVAPGDDLGSWYAKASFLLLTSRLESFSLVLAEAMLAGVIPVAYASDGPSFILQDLPEHLVRTGDEQALADRLIRFARGADPETLRQHLRDSIQERFSPDVIAPQWKELLQS